MTVILVKPRRRWPGVLANIAIFMYASYELRRIYRGTQPYLSQRLDKANIHTGLRHLSQERKRARYQRFANGGVNEQLMLEQRWRELEQRQMDSSAESQRDGSGPDNMEARMRDWREKVEKWEQNREKWKQKKNDGSK